VEKCVEIFHHGRHNNYMKQVEKDMLVRGVLEDELRRSQEMISSLEREIEELPRGSLHVRRKKYKDRNYEYHYLKYWKDGRSVSVHVSDSELNDMKEKLASRKAYEKEIGDYRKRVRYLEKILKI